MSARRFVIGMLVAVASAATAISAQTPAQGRDTRAAAAAPKGSAELSVLVTTEQQPVQPIRRAAVTIRAGELDIPHIGLTDDDGRVVFRDLAAGNYLLTAERQGFVRTYYGSPQPGRGPGVAITVLEGQHVAGIQLRLLHGGVITGTLRNASGRPAPNQAVRAIMIRSSGGERRAVNEEDSVTGRQVSTDDRGMYRIFGLPPGEYLISVPLSGISVEQMRQVTAEELQWADKVVVPRTTAAAGVNSSMPPDAPPPPDPPQPVAYSPVYYPGTTVAADATVITLGPNEERQSIDFGLQLVPTAQLSGRLVDSEGRPQAGQAISVKPLKSDDLDLFSSLLNSSGRTNPDGTFSITGVRPGAYTLTVRATPRTGNEPPPAPGAEAAAILGGLMGGGGPGTTHWASEDVSVQGADISGINLVLRPGMTVTGKVVYDATTKTPPTDLTKTAISLMAAPTGTDQAAVIGLILGGGSTTAKVAADGTFTISGVAPGRYRLNTPFGMIPIPTMSGLTGGWTLKSVMANGRDIADAPIDMKPGGDVSNVVVTFTDHPAELSGTVVDGAGRVTPNFPIVVFSTDRSYWTLMSRRVQTARPSSDGQFKVSGLPGGEYYVCAVTAVDRAEQYDPAFLEQLVGVATKITIADGERKVLPLKLGGG